MLGEVIRADTGHVGSLCNNGTKPLVAKFLGSGFVPDLKDLPQRTLKRQFGDLQTKSLLGMWCQDAWHRVDEVGLRGRTESCGIMRDTQVYFSSNALLCEGLVNPAIFCIQGRNNNVPLRRLLDGGYLVRSWYRSLR